MIVPVVFGRVVVKCDGFVVFSCDRLLLLFDNTEQKVDRIDGREERNAIVVAAILPKNTRAVPTN